MRKIQMLWFLLLLMVLVGCNGNSANSDNIPEDSGTDNQQETEETAENDSVDGDASDTTDETVDSETSDTTDEVTDETTDVSTDEVINEPVEEEPEVDLVDVDAYPSATVPVEFDFEMIDETTAVLIEDTEVINQLKEYIHDLYYNYYFNLGLEEESGTLTVNAMELFALSYIMQHEYNELKFDVETFSLYIPVEHVKQVVAKFFYRNLDVHQSYEDLRITYDNDMYVVIVEDGTWDDTLENPVVKKMGDFTYMFTCDVVSVDYGNIKHQIEAIIDETTDGYVIVNYNVYEYEETVED